MNWYVDTGIGKTKGLRFFPVHHLDLKNMAPMNHYQPNHTNRYLPSNSTSLPLLPT